MIPYSLISAVHLNTRMAVRDISRAGAFIDIPNPLQAGREVGLLLKGRDLPGGREVKAVVSCVEPAVAMGVEFTALSGEADRVLQQITERALTPNER